MLITLNKRKLSRKVLLCGRLFPILVLLEMYGSSTCNWSQIIMNCLYKYTSVLFLISLNFFSTLYYFRLRERTPNYIFVIRYKIIALSLVRHCCRPLISTCFFAITRYRRRSESEFCQDGETSVFWALKRVCFRWTSQSPCYFCAGVGPEVDYSWDSLWSRLLMHRPRLQPQLLVNQLS